VIRWALLLALCACDSDPVVMEDVGKVCMFAGPPDSGFTQMFTIGIVSTIHFGELPCTGCDLEQQASCTVTAEGTMLRIHTTASWVPSNKICNEACTLTADCTTEPLAEGAYNITFGPVQGFFLTIPSQLPSPPCLMYYPP
jgi:hypothetical protein